MLPPGPITQWSGDTDPWVVPAAWSSARIVATCAPVRAIAAAAGRRSVGQGPVPGEVRRERRRPGGLRGAGQLDDARVREPSEDVALVPEQLGRSQVDASLVHDDGPTGDHVPGHVTDGHREAGWARLHRVEP